MPESRPNSRHGARPDRRNVKETVVSLLPPSTNADYRGSPWSAAFLGLTGMITLVPGCIHYFLPDGGAGVIGGLDLTVHGKQIVGTFAWMGSLQIPYGLLM